MKPAFVRDTLFQSERVLRCQNCGGHWLWQSVEYDDESSIMSGREDGWHEKWVVPLSEEELRRIDAAIKGTEPLSRLEFVLGRRRVKLSECVWVSGPPEFRPEVDPKQF